MGLNLFRQTPTKVRHEERLSVLKGFATSGDQLDWHILIEGQDSPIIGPSEEYALFHMQHFDVVQISCRTAYNSTNRVYFTLLNHPGLGTRHNAFRCPSWQRTRLEDKTCCRQRSRGIHGPRDDVARENVRGKGIGVSHEERV